MKKLNMFLFGGLLILLILKVACSSDSNPVATEIPEHDHQPANIIENEALAELLNIEQPDDLIDVIGDPNDSTMVVTFITSTESNLFRYVGKSVSINIVRGVEIWYENIDSESESFGVTTDIGSSIGIIKNAVGNEVNTLEPGQFYYYFVQWNKAPFQFKEKEVIILTNFYALKGSTTRSLSKRARANRYGKRLFQ